MKKPDPIDLTSTRPIFAPMPYMRNKQPSPLACSYSLFSNGTKKTLSNEIIIPMEFGVVKHRINQYY